MGCHTCDDTKCKFCEVGNVSNCTRCNGNLGAYNGKCITCGARQILYSGVCHDCRNECAECSIDNKNIQRCSKCTNNNHYLQNREDGYSCLACPEGQVSRGDFKTCANCTVGCNVCTYPDIENCSTCNPSKYKQGKLCVDVCDDGYYIVGDTCTKCPTENCKKCTTTGVCTECQLNEQLTEQKKCIQCDGGKYSDDGKICSTCHTSCRACNAATEFNCTECATQNHGLATIDATYGTKPSTTGSGKCVLNCGPGAISKDDYKTCDFCADRTGCKVCNGTLETDSCLECITSTDGLANNTASDHKCAPCKQGYISAKDGFTCNRCFDTDCLTCTNSTNIGCTECDKLKKKVLDNGKCVPCDEGYYFQESNSTCQRCDDNDCAICLGAGTYKCTKCTIKSGLEVTDPIFPFEINDGGYCTACE